MLFRFADTSLDPVRRELRRAGEVLDLEPKVFDLLLYLVENRARLVSKQDLIAGVWGGRIVSDSALTSAINAARRAIGDSGQEQRLIRTLARKGYRFVGDLDEGADGGDPRTDGAPALPDKPSIAVLPFDNLSGDPEQGYFVDGMVEEIITSLSRIRWLFVIARNSSFTYRGGAVDIRQIGRELGVRYVLEGSVRRNEDRVRIAAQLIDAADGGHLWAERFDGSLRDIFDLQDRVAIEVAGAIEPTLQAAEIRRSTRRPTSDLTAYDLYLQALPHWFSGEKKALRLALDLLHQATERDPRFGAAFGVAADCQLLLSGQVPAEERKAARRRAVELARRALATGTDDPTALALAAGVLASGGEFEIATELIERALAANPGSSLSWQCSGWIRVFAGDPEPAIEHLERALRLSPRDPFAPTTLIAIGIAHFLAGRYTTALAKLQVGLERNPDFSYGHRFLIACHGHLGQRAAAIQAMARLHALIPEADPFDVSLLRRAEHRELVLSGLRLALAANEDRESR